MYWQEVRKNIWNHDVTREEDVARAVQFLNDTDRAFLKSEAAARFWEGAQKRVSPAFFTWLEDNIKKGNTSAPAPIQGRKSGA